MRTSLLLIAALLGFPFTSLAGPFTAKGTQPGLTHPILPGGVCQGCHGDYDASHDVEPGPTWSGSMMAQASRDPLFWAALDVANHDLPDIGEWCMRCHVSEGWLAGRSEPPGGSTDGCGLVGKLDEPNNDFDGVSCHLCHRMEVNGSPPPGQTSLYLDNAQYWLDDGDCGGQGEPCRHGPYDYSIAGAQPAPHPWAFSPYVQASELCATCHNVTNPAKNLILDGADAGIRFPIERTYREWQLSDFGFPVSVPGPDFTTCQGCHMPESGISPAYASSFLLNDHTGDLPVHRFVGGNAWIPDVLRQAYPNLGLGPNLQTTRDWALDLLQHHAATVTVSAPAAVRPGSSLAASVTVTNLTGHKLPTGYPEGRRMWLQVEARDGAGTLVWASGAYDPATGVLTRDAQAKVYESKQGVWNPATSSCETENAGIDHFHFVLNDCVALDNRIPPKGFTGGGDLQTHPVGYVYPETSPGSGVLVNQDVTSYSIPVPPTAVTPITVTATLRYQTTSKEYVDFLVDEADTHGFPNDCLQRTTGLPGKSRARVLLDLWNAYDRSPPVDMGSVSATAAVAAVDPYLCYKAKPTKGSTPFAPVPAIALDDDLGGGSFDAKKPALLCAAATAALDPSARLVAYQVKTTSGTPKPAPRTAITVQDAIGTLTLDAVKPELLALPAASGGPAPAADDLTCWKVKTSKGSSPFPHDVQVTTGSAFTSPSKTFALKKPRRLCVATDRDGNGRSTPHPNLLCYQAKPAKGQPKHVPAQALGLADDFGSHVLDAAADDELCLPATIAP